MKTLKRFSPLNMISKLNTVQNIVQGNYKLVEVI